MTFTIPDVNGVEALVHYATPIHDQPAAASLGYGASDLPATCHHVQRILSLPPYPALSPAQQNLLVELIADFFARGRAREARARFPTWVRLR